MTNDIYRCYRALELELGASREQVKQAWRELVKVWHPDRFPNDARLQRKALERLKEINCAYEVLERYFVTGNPPPQRRNSSYRTYDDSQWQGSQQSNSERQRAEAPPPQPPPSSTERTKHKTSISLGYIFWVGIVVAAVLVLIIWANYKDNLSPISSPSQPNVLPPISKVLDEKNGFKDFLFGINGVQL